MKESTESLGAAEKTEALLAASETAAWARFEQKLPVSYRSRYTRHAHRVGFDAGLEFARIALAADRSE